MEAYRLRIASVSLATYSSGEADRSAPAESEFGLRAEHLGCSSFLSVRGGSLTQHAQVHLGTSLGTWK